MVFWIPNLRENDKTMKQEAPTFSVVIPAYNYAHSIERAITSVLNQSSNDWELLVVDDGSTDNTVEFLKALSSGHRDQFSWVSQKNSGPAAARNKGIDNTTGDYLVFLDADDEMEPTALEMLGRSTKENPQAALLIGGHTSVSTDKPDKCHLPPPLPDSRFERVAMYLVSKTLSISNGATAIKRCAFSRYRFREDFRASEDIPVFVFVLANFDAATVNASIARIHKHADSLRHHTGHAKDVGMSLVEEVFSPDRMPANMQIMKSKFTSKRGLSLFRTLCNQKEYKDARKFYWIAFQHDWKMCLVLRHIGRLIRSCF